MRFLILALLPISLSGCDVSPNEAAICAGTLAARKAHAAALLVDGGPRSQDTGERLLTGMKAGCAE
ncbi:hypothetical protein GCM10017056_47740 [Seohaeicola zhoushanensis]|uniref:Lipoprotein n=1 Tax=Seohaeicola zhoushanensis TaxID=1569283 RepID=A0A8J3H3D4_9RHOB|nr:hypothetical protein GCM10017056_47740 [Seohaeicola zhoushanensis]